MTMRTLPKRRRNEDWTDEEVATLRRLNEAGVGYHEAVKELPNRTDKAVGQKARSLGLRRMTTRPPSWDQQEIDLVKEMWEQGISANEIAKALPGRTRNSVIGKVNRLKLSGQPTPKQVVARKLWQSEIQTKSALRLMAEGRSPLKLKVKKTKPVLLEVKPMVESLKIGLQDIKLDECHWPTNDDMQNVEFCGHPVAPLQGRPHYCAHHQWVSSPRSEIKCDAPEPGKKNWTPMGGLMVA